MGWWPSEDEQRVYLAVLDEWRAGTARLAARTGLPQRRVRTALAALDEHGLVRREGRQWAALAPDGVLDDWLLRRDEELLAVQRELADRRREMAELADTWQRAQVRRGAGAVVRLLSSTAEIQAVYEANIRATQREVLVMARPPMLRLPIEVGDLELDTMRAGVQWRTLYQTDFLELPGAPEFLASSAAAGEIARITPALPTKLMVHDRRTAMVPLEAAEPGFRRALVVSSSMLLEALVALFDLLWATATPTHGEQPEARAEDALFSLLASGLKDEAIARHLDCGVRTVRRRIAEGMLALGARTRFQAGLEAARRGWPTT